MMTMAPGPQAFFSSRPNPLRCRAHGLGVGAPESEASLGARRGADSCRQPQSQVPPSIAMFTETAEPANAALVSGVLAIDNVRVAPKWATLQCLTYSC